MIDKTKDCKIPTELVPVCPVCGGKMTVNVRVDANFVQDENWYKQDKRYGEFLDRIQDKNVVLLEIFPFELMAFNNINKYLVRINKVYAFASKVIEGRTILFNEDTNKIIEDLKEFKR